MITEPYRIRIKKEISNKEEAANMMNQVFTMVEQTFKRGWSSAVLTVELECQEIKEEARDKL
jgi:hypothetical protein